MADHETKSPDEPVVHHEVHDKQPVTQPSNKGPLIGVAIAIGVAVLLVGLGGGFLAGIATGKLANAHRAVGTRSAPMYQSGDGPMSGQRFGGNRGVSRVIGVTKGSVTAISSDSISVKTDRGVVVTYTITSATKVMNGTATASVSDIKTGDTVSVQQADDTSGSAATIKLNP